MPRHPRGLVIAGIVALGLVPGGCGYFSFVPEIPYLNPPPPAAVATLTDSSGRAAGQAVMVEEGGGVRLLLDVIGLPPGAKAVHFHEVGQCIGPSFTSAGKHFNPTQAEHGTANPRGPHAGDLPDMTVDASGRGHLEVTVKRVRLKKGPSSLIDEDGSALVVHERGDDGRTDPDGGAGARIACGAVIPAGKP